MLLTDVTLMTVDWRRVPVERTQALYRALLAVGVLVQIPFGMAERLRDALAPERTLLALNPGDPGLEGYAGTLCGAFGCGLPGSIVECSPDVPALPPAGGYRLRVEADAFLGDYHGLFQAFAARTQKPITLCACGATPFATALTVEWLFGGYGQAAVSFLGQGGYASLAEVAVLVATGGKGAVDTQALDKVAAAWEWHTGQQVPPYQPVVGRRIFDVGSGLHINGLLKDDQSYEPFPPEMVCNSRRYVLGKHSGASAVAAKLVSMGLDPAAWDTARLAQQVRALGAAMGEVDEQTLTQLLAHTGKEARL